MVETVTPPTILPRQPTIDAYRTVILQAPFARWFANSAVVALAVVATRCALDTLAGYAFARMRFPGRELLFSAVISTLMVVRILPTVRGSRTFRPESVEIVWRSTRGAEA